MTARQIRRAQEHKARKLAYKAAKAEAQAFESCPDEPEPILSETRPEEDLPKTRAVTPARLAANRANAAHSTGPKTENGKAASSQNSFRHGLTGTFRLLESEDAGDYAYLSARLRDEHKPATPTEEILVERMAQHIWLSQRAQNMQTAWIDDGKQLALYIRYQATNDRGFHKCLNDLLKLRAEKRKEANGFVLQQHKQAAEARKEALDEAALCQRAEDSSKEKRRAELHPWKVLRAEAEAEHSLLVNADLPERILRAESAAQQAAA